MDILGQIQRRAMETMQRLEHLLYKDFYFIFFFFLQSKGDWTLKQVDLLSGYGVSIWVDA